MSSEWLDIIFKAKVFVVLVLLVTATSALGQALPASCDWIPSSTRTVRELTAEPTRSLKPESQKVKDGDYFVVSTKDRLYLHSLPNASCKSSVYLVRGDVVEVIDLYPKSGLSVKASEWARIIFSSKQVSRDYIAWVKIDGLCQMLPSGGSECGVAPIGDVGSTDEKTAEEQRVEAKATELAKVVEEMQAVREAEERKAREEAEKVAVEEKARAFAQSSKTEWELFQKTDEMSGEEDILAGADVSVGNAKIEAELRCASFAFFGVLELTLTIFDASFAWVMRDYSSSTSLKFDFRRVVNGRIKLNEEVSSTSFEIDKVFRNVVKIYFGHKTDGVLDTASSWDSVRDRTVYEPVYAVMFEVDTTQGKALIYVPPFDSVVASVIQDCPDSR